MIRNYIIIGIGAAIMIFGLALSYYVLTYECPPEHNCPANVPGASLIILIPIALIGAGIMIVGIILEWRKKRK